MVKNQLPIIFSLSNFRTAIFFNYGKMLQTFPVSYLHRMEHFTSKITWASLASVKFTWVQSRRREYMQLLGKILY